MTKGTSFGGTMLSPSPRPTTFGATTVARPGSSHASQRSKETIHSGHFMVSDFEAEAQDDEDEVAIPVPESDEAKVVIQATNDNAPAPGGASELAPTASIVLDEPTIFESGFGMSISVMPELDLPYGDIPTRERKNSQTSVAIDQSLTKLFQCMSLAYSHKLTSPRWKNFKGLRLSWKDKIRLNNIIWRSWHEQFVRKQSTQICQFASPLDVDQHNKPEAVVLEGKYWKRRLATVTAEYKKWRIFFKNKLMGRSCKETEDIGMHHDLEALDWFGPRSNGSCSNSSFPVEDDFYMDFSDTLFSSLTSNQPFPFPNPREISRGVSLADFIQPGLVQLQPNLDDFMDTFEPLQDLLSVRLPPVEEESSAVEDSGAFNGNNPLQNSSALSREESARREQPNVTSMNESFTSAMDAYMSVDGLPSEPGMFFTQEQPRSNRGLSNYEPNQANQLVIPQMLVQPARDAESIPQPVEDSSFRSQQRQQEMVTCVYLPSNPYMKADVSSQSAQEIFVVPKTSLKTRSRSRSGSSVNAAPCPPPLTNRLTLSSSQPSLAPLPTVHNSKSAPATSHGGARSKSTRSTPSTLVASAVATVSSLPASRGPGRAGSLGNVSNLVTANALRIPVPNTATPTLVQENALMQLLTSDRISSTSYVTRTALPAAPAYTKVATSSSQTVIDTGGLNLLADVGLRPFNLSEETTPSSGKSNTAPSTPTATVPPSLPPTHSKPFRPRGEHERGQYKEHRRVCHINAEQKRRCNIKNGFDTLHSLLPGLGGSASGSGSSTSPSHSKVSEVSKAALLQRGAEYIRQLKAERLQQTEEVEQLRQCIESLNGAISGCQAQLPATGAPVSRQRSSRIKEMFDEWVRIRTLHNWKFWIFSLLIQPLLNTYVATVSTASIDDLCRTVLQWVDQHCSLVALRPAVLSSLRHLSTSTDILTDPSRLPAQAAQAVCKGEQPSQTLH